MEERIDETRQEIVELERSAENLSDEERKRRQIRLHNARGVAWWHVAWSIVGQPGYL